MLTPIPDLPEGLAGLTASGTVTAGDLPDAIRGLDGARTEPLALLVSVDPEFDGYMAELVRGLHHALDDGRLARCALVLPDAMLPEARLQGAPPGFRAFPGTERHLAESWAQD